MFKSKKTKLFTPSNLKVVTSESSYNNKFLTAGMKRSAKTVSGNNSKKFSETNDPFITQFGKIGEYRQKRTFDEISKSMSILWNINKRLAIVFILYIRTITRITSFFDGLHTKTIQRGAGLKHEAMLRMIWLHVYHPNSFWKNIKLYIAVGSWKDIISMLSYDIQYNSWNNKVLDWRKMGKLILSGLENPNISNLVKKYLPQIKSNNKCTTIESQADNIIAKWIASLLFYNKNKIQGYVLYRRLKVSGTAHDWQQLISRGDLLHINFNTISGKALAQLVSSKFLVNNGLQEKYDLWMKNKPILKFNGYVHDLFKEVSRITKKYQIDTLNKQFLNLIRVHSTDSVDHTNFIVARDTSLSMRAPAVGINTTSDIIAKSLALYFSYLLPKGPFSKAYINFASKPRMQMWIGNTPYEKFINDTTASAGSTNFQGIISLLVKIKKQGIPESQFPSGILCISDGEFNKTDIEKTNVKGALQQLKKAKFSESYIKKFKIVLWNIPNTFYSKNPTVKFETYNAKKDNIYYFSGFDGSVLSFLTGTTYSKSTPKNSTELFLNAMNQEILNLVRV